MNGWTRPPRRQIRRPGMPRTIVHKVKVTSAQELELRHRAAEQDVTVSRLMVEAALRDEPAPVEVDPVTRQAMAELFGLSRLLGKMSTNLNQIARAANATGEVQAATVTAADATKRVAGRIDEWIARGGR
jgi:hypothetical protein